MTDDEIMALFDQANKPCMVTTAHSPWHKAVLLRFARSLLDMPRLTADQRNCRHVYSVTRREKNGLHINHCPDCYRVEVWRQRS